MIARFARARLVRLAALAGAGALLCGAALAQQPAAPPLLPAAPAPPPINMKAHFDIIMTHIQVGELNWAVYFDNGGYTAAASGKASGVFSVLVKGEGSVTTNGSLVGGRLVPTRSRSEVSDDDGTYSVALTFANGAVAHVAEKGAPPPEDRVRVTENLLHNVADPLSAMLIPSGGNAFAPGNCDRTLRIFDGRRRYNLALSYKRLDKVKMKRGYVGKVLVCTVVLRPIAGYRVGSLLVRYLAGKDDLEMWFAPIAGVAIMAPVRALMPTLIGTMDIRADEFTARHAHAAAPVPAKQPVQQ
jgi:Protein of unknown function (DUF3108)